MIPNAGEPNPRLIREDAPGSMIRGRLRVVPEPGEAQTDANAATALWPPKPNELLIANWGPSPSG
jgi:hypothetical protein